MKNRQAGGEEPEVVRRVEEARRLSEAVRSTRFSSQRQLRLGDWAGMKNLIRLVVLTAVLAPHAVALGGAGQAFRSGDLYFSSNALFGLSSGNFGILRIDPVSGQADAILGPVGGGANSGVSLAYDPYRDRLITSAALDGVNKAVYFVDAAGAAEEAVGFSSQSVSNFAPTGDGRIYLTVQFGLAADIQYIDATGAVQQLMDASGSSAFQLSASIGNGADFDGMIYEPGTNALFIATSATTIPCGSSDLINVYRVPLSADGSQVSGSVQCAEYDIDPTSSSEVPEGWSRGPLGDLFLVVDTNSNAQQSRMLRVDPATLNITSYASNGSYLGAAATNAGSYSHILGQGAIVDSFAADIRLYGQGEVGDGTFMGVASPSGTDLYGNGQHAALIEIGPVGSHDGLIAAPLGLSVAAGGTQSWTLRTGAAFAGETYLMLGSLSGWNPSTPLAGAVLPLVFDSHTVFTIVHANSATLPNSLGTLGPDGDALAGLVLPPAAVGPGAVGAIAYHAALILDGALAGVHATNAVQLELLP